MPRVSAGSGGSSAKDDARSGSGGKARVRRGGGGLAEDEVPDIASTHPSDPSSTTVADHRPDVYVEEREAEAGGLSDEITGVTGVVVYRLSRILSCPKALTATRLGIEGEEAPEWLLERFQEGADMESVILDMVFGGDADSGGCPFGNWKLLDPNDRQSYRQTRTHLERYPHIQYRDAGEAGTGQFTAEIPLGAGRIARGHLDGIAELYGVAFKEAKDAGVKNGDRAVVEVKLLATAEFNKYKKLGVRHLATNLNYAGQISGYMIASGLPALYVIAEKLVEDGDKQDDKTRGANAKVTIGEVLVLWIPEPIVSLGKLKAAAARVEKQADKGDFGTCDETMWPCPVWFLHEGEGRDKLSVGDGREAEVPDDMVEQFIAAVSKYNRAGIMERDAKKMKDEAKEVIEKTAAEAGVVNGGVLKTPLGNVEWVVEEVEASVVERRAYTKRYPKASKAMKEKINEGSDAEQDEMEGEGSDG